MDGNETTDRKTEILDAAEDLLRTRSFSAFSYQDIADRLGIRKASIHYHFATKDDLGVALCDRFHRRFCEWAQRVDTTCRTSAAKLTEFLRFSGCILAGDNKKICATGILEAEFNVISERMRGCVQKMVAEQTTWLTRVLAEGRARHELQFTGQPEHQATLIIAALQGALQIARVFGPDRFAAVASQIETSMKLHPT